MSLKVIQWATGVVGRAAIQYVITHPQLELVGCWVHSADKDGVDAGELAGGEAIGILATTDIDALVALEAGCVMYSPIMPDESIVCRLLESGKNVVTPLGWIFPGSAMSVVLSLPVRLATAPCTAVAFIPVVLPSAFP